MCRLRKLFANYKTNGIHPHPVTVDSWVILVIYNKNRVKIQIMSLWFQKSGRHEYRRVSRPFTLRYSTRNQLTAFVTRLTPVSSTALRFVNLPRVALSAICYIALSWRGIFECLFSQREEWIIYSRMSDDPRRYRIQSDLPLSSMLFSLFCLF